jgi:hypothetical protein
MILRFTDSDDEPAYPSSPFSESQVDPADSVFILASDSESEPPDQVFQLPSPPTHDAGTFRFIVTTQFTFRGRRTHYQLARDGYPLFHSKSKSWRPSSPIGISFGASSHFSQSDFVAIVVPGPKRRTFAVKHGNSSLLNIEFAETRGPHPKSIRISIGSEVFVNQQPKMGDNGHWQLSFGGKLAIPSVKNCIIVSEANSEIVALQMRRVSASNCELDSFGVFPPLCIFAYAIATFVSPI